MCCIVSSIGDFESGKSTLVGVLTRACLDDGNGLARMQVVKHRHEIENGCTSSISEHTVGITDTRRLCSPESELNEQDDTIVSTLTFSDLAGHKKYFKVTASGLASQFPDYVMLVVDSTKGVQGMTMEHLQIALALEVEVFIVLTKTDLATSERITQSITEVTKLLYSFCPTKKVLCMEKMEEQLDPKTMFPLFLVSNVTGNGLTSLQRFLAALSPKRVCV